MKGKYMERQLHTIYSTILKEWHAWYVGRAWEGARGKTEEEAIEKLKAKYSAVVNDAQEEEEQST